MIYITRLYRTIFFSVLLAVLLILTVVLTNHQDIRIEAVNPNPTHTPHPTHTSTPTPTVNPYCEFLDGKWRLCHHNPSQNVDLAFNGYHECDNHTGTPHNNETFDTAGYCPVATSTPTNTPIPTATPTSTPTIEVPTATPTVEKGCGDDCDESPTPTIGQPTPTGEERPTGTPEPTVHQDSNPIPPPNNEQHAYGANQCVGDPPKAPLLQGFMRVNPTTVKFNWWPDEGVDHFALSYGYDQNNLNMGIPFIVGNATEVTVSGLQANKMVWARLMAEAPNFCVSWSNLIDP